MADFTDATFAKEVLQETSVPVLVDFWAPWCGPCKMVSPIIDELAIEYQEKVKVGKLNVDENPTTASQYGVMSIPSIFIFKDGKPVKSMVGALGKENFKKAIDEVLTS
ncbi:MAG: thioredoxin [Candidatus Levybacteria bacterium RIFCSPHIGHO2_02_FULL_42_12]|nr:MAG: thioredoxin [Candidatus Levybacteria bacterium RIFCSPHIGHO2_02_FULL_42_12]OGH42056.1 MAG: thioredoxin [Candidatus Levybacteria bacterium RIFCSPLOWO2_01_FULL_42_15]